MNTWKDIVLAIAIVMVFSAMVGVAVYSTKEEPDCKSGVALYEHLTVGKSYQYVFVGCTVETNGR